MFPSTLLRRTLSKLKIQREWALLVVTVICDLLWERGCIKTDILHLRNLTKFLVLTQPRSQGLSSYRPLARQSWTKVLRHFTETNAFKLTIIFCVWMKTPFSSVILPPSPNQTPRGCLFVSNIKKGGRGLPFIRGGGRIHTKGKKVVLVVCLNDFCPWLELWGGKMRDPGIEVGFNRSW